MSIVFYGVILWITYLVSLCIWRCVLALRLCRPQIGHIFGRVGLPPRGGVGSNGAGGRQWQRSRLGLACMSYGSILRQMTFWGEV